MPGQSGSVCDLRLANQGLLLSTALSREAGEWENSTDSFPVYSMLGAGQRLWMELNYKMHKHLYFAVKVENAMAGVRFIAQHIRDNDKDNEVRGAEGQHFQDNSKEKEQTRRTNISQIILSCSR